MSSPGNTPNFGFDRYIKQPCLSYRHDIYNFQNYPYYNQNGNWCFYQPKHSGMPFMDRPNSICNNDYNYAYQKALSRGEHNISSAIPLSTVRPGSVWPSEAQLDLAFAYGIRRPDGSITRLIRADHLNTPYMDHHIPQWQTQEEGLIILPEPRQLSPNRRQGRDPLVSQRKIHELNRSVVSSAFNSYMRNSNQTQLQVDSIVNTDTNKSVINPSPHRRQKVYCDKWIHEGVCAFTQVGCKFKHEMPSDRKTQISLGLNHGYPKWYRSAYGHTLSSRPVTSINLPSVTRQSKTLEYNWRRQSDTASSNNSFDHREFVSDKFLNFGPIGPPSSQMTVGSRTASSCENASCHLGQRR